MNKHAAAFILLFGILTAIPFHSGVFATRKMNSPKEFVTTDLPQKDADKNEAAFSNIVFGEFILFFRNAISPLDGPRSPSYPTGSAYGKQVVKKYGFVLGSILTADRLFHETDFHYGAFISIDGTRRYYDPPELNTFWWDSEVSPNSKD